MSGKTIQARYGAEIAPVSMKHAIVVRHAGLQAYNIEPSGA